jgi:hypothetical protein
MAIIPCPECAEPVSSAAVSCPKCGYPISSATVPSPSSVKAPAFPADINLNFYVGATGFFKPLATMCKVLDGSTAFGSCPGADVYISQLDEGVWIQKLEAAIVKIHFAQIASIHFLEKVKQQAKSKSVLGRAIFGAVLLGPLGAVVGGMSGVGSKLQSNDGFVMNYWDTKRAEYVVLGVESGDSKISSIYSMLSRGSAPFASLHS